MVNSSKESKNTGDSSPIQQMLNLINKVSGKQPDMKVDVQNLKLNIAHKKLTVNANIDIRLPPTDEVHDLERR
jgi:hypothetical protein